jgi:hypothetical protein
MSAEAVKLVEQTRLPAPETEAAPDVAVCSLVPLAAVLAQLLQRPLTAEQLWRKAVGLGLVRWPVEGAEPLLTARAASRLLIVGYGVPGHLEAETPHALRDHGQACRHAFVLAPPRGDSPGQVVVAARRWSDLPAQGAVFFGGMRDRYGSYHWNVAELETDREGRILRY